MLLKLPIWAVILLNVLGCPALQLFLAWAFTRMPVCWFSPAPTPASKRHAARYEHLFAIRAWKDRLPDGARWFSRGFSKGQLQNATPQYLARFIAETRRGEQCHLAALAVAPLFFLWNPPWACLILAAYFLAANLPCIVVQRYNRLRLSQLLSKSRKPASRQTYPPQHSPPPS